MSRHLEKELESLKKKLLSLTAVVETSVYQSVSAVNDRNAAIGQKVIDGDDQIDRMEVDIEEECLKILALYQPVAADLRYVVAALKMDNDLERIADLAVNIAERAVFLAQADPVPIPFDFKVMAETTRQMLCEAIESFVDRDVQKAFQVCRMDDQVDAINREMYGQVYQAIRRDPAHTESLIHYLSVSRHLERIADYATNIAEDVIYLVDGTIIRHQPENY